MQINGENAEEVAGKLYEAYCHAVGRTAVNGDALPSWAEFRSTASMKKRSDAWLAVAVAAGDIFHTHLPPHQVPPLPAPDH